MSVSYIPKNVNTLCTFQKDSPPRKLVDDRAHISVFFNKNQQRTLLTMADRNINAEFPCKSPTNAMWSFLAFGAGLIVGAVLVLSGPVGWAVIAVGVAAMAVGAYQATKIKHKCTPGLHEGSWKFEHPRVKFDKEYAITHNSMLLCNVGGVLSPIFNLSIPNKYAGKINSHNNWEIGYNAVASFFGGAGAVIAFSEAAGVMAYAKLTLWMGGTMAAVNVGTYAEKGVIRSTAISDNQHYQDMNAADSNDIVPGYVKDPTGSTPGDLGSQDILEVDGKTGWFARDPDGKMIVVFNGKQYVKDIKGNYRELRQGSELAKDLQTIKDVKPREMHSNEDARRITRNIREGKYSDNLIKASKDGNEVVRPRNLNKILPDLKTVKIQNWKNLGKLGVKGGGFIAFLFPFAATWLSEKSRMELASAMADDMGNGISIVANQV
jgi:hypothetical protein